MLPVIFLLNRNGRRSPIARVAARERFAICANNRRITGDDQAKNQAAEQAKNRRDNRGLSHRIPRNGWQFRASMFLRCVHFAPERLTLRSASSINAALSIFPQ
jgi:hypothetical protein